MLPEWGLECLKDNECGILCVRVRLWKGFCWTGAVAKVTLVTILPKKKKTLLNLNDIYVMSQAAKILDVRLWQMSYVIWCVFASQQTYETP